MVLLTECIYLKLNDTNLLSRPATDKHQTRKCLKVWQKNKRRSCRTRDLKKMTHWKTTATFIKNN